GIGHKGYWFETQNFRINEVRINATRLYFKKIIYLLKPILFRTKAPEDLGMLEGNGNYLTMAFIIGSITKMSIKLFGDILKLKLTDKRNAIPMVPKFGQ
ncbi:hypothetical protein BpHYR1_006686, partial [Brachionus plicatilis]